MWSQLEELPLDELNLVDCMYFFMNISNLAYNPGPRLAQRFTVRRPARVRASWLPASWQLTQGLASPSAVRFTRALARVGTQWV